MVRRLGSSTTGTARVWALTVVLGAIALVLATIELPAGQLAQAPVAVPWWLLAGLFYLTEAKVVHLHIGRSAHSFSMSEIPVVYGIFFFRPAEFIVARLIGADWHWSSAAASGPSSSASTSPSSSSAQ